MPAQHDDYCSFTKAVEHLGDRWSLLIIREIQLHGRRGFNALVETLPGISRSVLARRLRNLEMMGLIAREASVQRRPGPYVLAPAGQQLLPTLLSLSDWAERWVPEDPAIAEKDPDVITFWLTLRVADRRALPDPPVVLAIDLRGAHSVPNWLVLERGATPSLCVEDPMLPQERYLHVEADAAALFPIARGLRTWDAAMEDRSVRVYGDPGLIRQLSSWFLPTDASTPSPDPMLGREPVLAVSGAGTRAATRP